jgi:hypothetical protein
MTVARVTALLYLYEVLCELLHLARLGKGLE